MRPFAKCPNQIHTSQGATRAGPLSLLIAWILLMALGAPYVVKAHLRASPSAVPAPTALRAAQTIDKNDPDLVVTPAPLPIQPAGVRFLDPAFGHTLRRVANTSQGNGFETHEYSQLQAFSDDNVYLLLDGSNGYIVRRVDDLSLLPGLDTSGWNAPRWQPAQPHTIVHYDSNEDTTLRVHYTDLERRTTTTHFTFPDRYQRIRGNQSFDELSRDGRWMAGMASLANGERMLFALDLQNRTLGAQLVLEELYCSVCEQLGVLDCPVCEQLGVLDDSACAPDPTWGILEPDWIGVSPLGNYLVVQWPRDGTQRCSGLETFDLQSGAFAGRVYEGHQHGDLGVDADGVTEFFMTFELAAPPPDNNFPAIGVRMLPGTNQASEPAYIQVTGWFQSHVSCQGPDGVCLVTMSTVEHAQSPGGYPANRADDDPAWSPLEGELFLQYVDGSVQRLAHHRSSNCGYWVQPRASLSRDGRYVVFASDWGAETQTDSCGDGNDLGRGDAYLIELDAQATPTITPTAMITTTPTPEPSATASPTTAPSQTPTRVPSPSPVFQPGLFLPQVMHEHGKPAPTATRTPTGFQP